MCGYVYPARMRRGKVIGLSILSPRKSPDLEIQASEQLVSVTNQSKSETNWLECTLNRLSHSTNVTNSVFLLRWPSQPRPSTVPTCTSTLQAFCSCAQLAWQRSSTLQVYLCCRCYSQARAGYVPWRALVIFEICSISSSLLYILLVRIFSSFS